MTSRPTILVAKLEKTSPARYSEIASGVENRFRKFRDQTSSKKAVVTPCMTRVKKSQSSTAPSSAGTKLKPEDATELRYRVMNPHRMISIATQPNSGRMRAGLPR